MKTVQLEKSNEEEFLRFLQKDEIRHVFTICDLRYDRNKTQIWTATENHEIYGYLFEFDKRIVHTYGTAESITQLIRHVDLSEPTFVIEPHHLTIVRKFFEPIEPTDKASKSKITTYLIMKTTAKTFKPLIQHRIKKLDIEDIKEVAKNFGEEWANRIKDAIGKGIAYGAYDNYTLASTATTLEILDTIALIRGVYTVDSLRGKGLATSVVSAIVKEIINLDKDAVLWVAKDNVPARRVYEKIGFQRTQHVLLGFMARKL
ncbi:MAG: GNAT family N-acetyltransferase [Candidatus Bathyarchaeota archaeon]|nr:GNAT family N-acetyltransferase [Candidatus Bathyarchaeota archaeon]